jgi:hypothetical protein
MASISGKVAGIYAAAVGTPTAFTDEATTANAAKTIFTITAATKRAWPLDATIVVKYNGSVVTTGFTLQRAGGKVVFDTSPGASAVTVSGTFSTVTECAGMYDWKETSSVKEQDVTDFTAATATGCETHAAVGLTHNTLACSSYWQSTAFQAAIGALYYVKAFISATTGERYEGWCVLTAADTDAAIDSIIEQPLTFQPTGGFWYSAS